MTLAPTTATAGVMIALLSPAKTLDFERPLPPLAVSTPHFAEEARSLAKSAAKLTPKRLAELMHISPRLAMLNADRFRDFADLPERPALYAFAGDVYTGFEVDSLDEVGVAFAQDHVRMLSGLYGLLRPLDAIRPYRLEMGTRWAPRHKKLTHWWGDRIAQLLRAQIAEEGSGVVLNLASQEYFAAVDGKLAGVRIIDVDFREPGPNGPRFISFNAKRARGMMARWLCEHCIADPEAMRDFDSDGYRFDAAESETDRWRFTRA
ncbi:peroxide stress protein YaaA [soil metagenome]